MIYLILTCSYKIRKLQEENICYEVKTAYADCFYDEKKVISLPFVKIVQIILLVLNKITLLQQSVVPFQLFIIIVHIVRN